MRRLLLKVWLLAWLVLAWSTRASAETGAADRASAQALFDEGKQLLESGQAAAACPKLEESLKLDPAIGTRYQLAKCYELTSRIASAWTLYLEVAAEARTSGQGAREEFARKQAEKLEPELSYLTIVVPTEARADGLRVTRNGVALGRGSWNAKLPVDPGRYTIVATAPGKKEWQGSIEVTGPKGSESIAIPQLADAPKEAKQPEPTASPQQTPADTGNAPSDRRLTTRHWVGIGLAGAGVIALGAGGVFALKAKNLDDESGCNNGNCPTEGALQDNHDARRAGEVATVLGIAGGALVLGGVAVFFAPVGGAGQTQTAVVPALGPGMAGLEVYRSF